MSEPGGELEPLPADEPIGPPPRSGRPLLLAVLGVGVLALASLPVVLLEPTLFGRTLLDRGAVQRDVAAQFQQREGVAVTLDCPRAMPLVPGAGCTAGVTTQ